MYLRTCTRCTQIIQSLQKPEILGYPKSIMGRALPQIRHFFKPIIFIFLHKYICCGYSLEVHLLAWLYESTGTAIALPPVSALVSVLTKMLMFYIKVLKTLYFLNPQMDLVYIWYVYRCWSKILLNSIHIPAHDLEVKITDLEIYVKVLHQSF